MFGIFKPVYNVPVNQSKTHWGTNGDDIHIGIWGTDTFYASYGADGYYGRGGSDRVNYKWSNAAVNVDLTTGRGEGGMAQGDRYHSVENITGSRYDDFLRGNASNNSFDGGSGDDTFRATNGNDTYNGGHGRHDRIEYFDQSNGIIVTLNSGNGTVVQAGSSKVDRFINVEEISGTHFSDAFIGDDGDNWFFGADGDDAYYADAGADEYFGGFGNDELIIIGDNLTINLGTGRGYGGDAEGDRYTDINSVNISGAGNTVIGDSGANTITASGKFALIDTKGGNDTVILSDHAFFNVNLGSGDDTLIINPLTIYQGSLVPFSVGHGQAGSGNDTLDFSKLDTGVAHFQDVFGQSTTTLPQTASFSVSNFYGGYQFTGGSAVLELIEFENIIGTDFDDIFGGNGSIDETFTGGKGEDEFFFALYRGDNDTITDFETGRDTLHFYGLQTDKPGFDNFQLLLKGDVGDDVYMQETHAGTMINIFETQIMLEGVQIADLSTDDFMWS